MLPREYPDRPWVGIGVVVFRDDNVLLIQRGKPPRKGQWSLPGGAQRLGETAVAAAKREVKEETALDISVLGLIDVVDSIQKDDAGSVQYHYTLVDFVAVAKNGDAVAGDDAQAAIWVRLPQLVDYALWPETVRIIDAARKIYTAHNKICRAE